MNHLSGHTLHDLRLIAICNARTFEDGRCPFCIRNQRRNLSGSRTLHRRDRHVPFDQKFCQFTIVLADIFFHIFFLDWTNLRFFLLVCFFLFCILLLLCVWILQEFCFLTVWANFVSVSVIKMIIFTFSDIHNFNLDYVIHLKIIFIIT